jgi:Fe-S-cluster-containing dehydrogenase component
MKLYKITINEYLCDGCGDCYTACPINASLRVKGILSGKTAVILVSDGRAKQGVDGCVKTCHKHAISLSEIK